MKPKSCTHTLHTDLSKYINEAVHNNFATSTFYSGLH